MGKNTQQNEQKKERNKSYKQAQVATIKGDKKQNYSWVTSLGTIEIVAYIVSDLKFHER